MKMSRRARRMERHHKRKEKAGLNMVSLMDIFTILLVFLLVSASDTQISTSSKVKLPESKASLLPEETLVITVNSEDILVQGRRIAAVADVIDEKSPIITELQKELEFHASNVVLLGDKGQPEVREVTIMGDKEIPYKLLKKIMLTCTRVNYSNISLAVTKEGKKG